MPNIKDTSVEPRGSTIEDSTVAAYAAGAQTYSTTVLSKPPTQPNNIRFWCIVWASGDCTSTAAMPAELRTLVRLRRLNKGEVTRRVCQVSGSTEFTGWVGIVCEL